MKQLCPHIDSVTGDETQQRPLAKLRRNLGEVFLTALVDPATVGMLLNADGTLWQERLGEENQWRPIETMPAARVEAVRTVAAIASQPVLEVEFPLDGSRVAGQILPVAKAKTLSLKCACCRPTPLQAAPKPLFRLCWRKICLMRNGLKQAEREEHILLSNPV